MVKFILSLFSYPPSWSVHKNYWVVSRDNRPVLRVPNFRSECYDG